MYLDLLPQTQTNHPAFSCDHWLGAHTVSAKPLPTTYSNKPNCTAPDGPCRLTGGPNCSAGEPDRHWPRPGAGKQPPHRAQKQNGFSAAEAASTNAHPSHPGQGQDHDATRNRTRPSPLGEGGQAGQRTTAQRPEEASEHMSYTTTGTETDQQPPARRTTHPRQSTGKATAHARAQTAAAAADRKESTTTHPDWERTDRRTTNALAKDKPDRSHQEETTANAGIIINPQKELITKPTIELYHTKIYLSIKIISL